MAAGAVEGRMACDDDAAVDAVDAADAADADMTGCSKEWPSPL